MITRPLELLGRLRPPPRNFDYLYLLNAGLIGLFFVFFGSRFVLSPVLHLTGDAIEVPQVSSAAGSFAATSIYVTLEPGGQYVVDTGNVTYEQLQEWLRRQKQRDPQTILLIRADKRVTSEHIVTVVHAAREVGIEAKLAVETNRPDGT